MKGMIVTALLLSLLASSVARGASNPLSDRLNLFDAAGRLCLAKTISSAELTSSVMRSGNWTLSHICECASALTISRMTDQDVTQALAEDHQADFNLKLSTSMSACIHMQP